MLLVNALLDFARPTLTQGKQNHLKREGIQEKLGDILVLPNFS